MRLLLVLLFLCAALGQIPQDSPPLALPRVPAETRLPGGKKQREQIVKADYKNNLEDAVRLAKLAEELKSALERGNEYVVSVPMIKQTEEIERLAKGIRSRLKRY